MPAKKPDWEVAFEEMLDETKFHKGRQHISVEELKAAFKMSWDMAKAKPLKPPKPKPPKEIRINVLQDFNGSLRELREIVAALIADYGSDKTIYFDAGHNNVSVVVLIPQE